MHLPDKSIASLVKYYYSWKKTRSRTSLMDKQARKLNTPKEDGVPSEAGSEAGSNEESDHEDKVSSFNVPTLYITFDSVLHEYCWYFDFGMKNCLIA
ncbi:hypothetical protein NQ314_006857 [Rhamnusium bicolor]|uniref:SANT domain-containing protein n=1 Tax=Rhamnusium bicolor TaxID=1586634 RepID=A0AAV8YVJ5_9CUCU|nr:hypothetical protein NQ314_006857 [Rhamnusium bicolor]